MLDKLRSSASTWVMRVILIGLAASFAVWGIGDIFRDGGSNTVATVGDASISPRELDEQFRREIQSTERRLQRPIDSEQARAFGLLDRALGQLVGRALMSQEMAALGVTVDDRLVAEQLYKTPAFQSDAGRFDADLYKSVLTANGYTATRYENELRREIAQRQLLGSLSGAVEAPRALVDALHRYRGETRTLSVATVSVSPDSVADPDRAALKAYYDENAERFTAPEYRKVTYLELSPKTLAGEVDVTEDDLKAEYEGRAHEFTTPEKRTVEQMVFSDRKSAEAALARIREGGDFIAVAKDATGQDENGIKLGTLEKGDLLPDLGDAVFSLAPNRVSDPVESALGWHLFRVTGIEEGAQTPLAEVRAEIERSFRERRAFDLLYPRANDIEDELAAGSSLAEIARVMNLTLKTVPAVDANGRSPAGEDIADLPAPSDFLQATFSTEAGQTSDLIETSAGSYFLMRVDAITPETVRPLDKVRADVIAAYKREQAVKAAAERAEAIKAAAEVGASLADAVAKVDGGGVEITGVGPIDRSGRGEGNALPVAMVADVFAAEDGGVVQGRRPNGEQIVAVVDTIAEPAPLEGDERDQFAQAVAQSLGTDILIQYEQALRTAYPTSVNTRVIENMY